MLAIYRGRPTARRCCRILRRITTRPTRPPISRRWQGRRPRRRRPRRRPRRHWHGQVEQLRQRRQRRLPCATLHLVQQFDHGSAFARNAREARAARPGVLQIRVRLRYGYPRRILAPLLPRRGRKGGAGTAKPGRGMRVCTPQRAGRRAGATAPRRGGTAVRRALRARRVEPEEREPA